MCWVDLSCAIDPVPKVQYREEYRICVWVSQRLANNEESSISHYAGRWMFKMVNKYMRKPVGGLQQDLTGTCCDEQILKFLGWLCFIDSIVQENEHYLGEEEISTSCDITRKMSVLGRCFFHPKNALIIQVKWNNHDKLHMEIRFLLPFCGPSWVGLLNSHRDWQKPTQGLGLHPALAYPRLGAGGKSETNL